MCFCFQSNEKIVIFSFEKLRPPKLLLIFFLEKTHSEKDMEIVEDLIEKSYNNNGTLWKSSRIFLVKPKNLRTFTDFAFWEFFIFHVFSYFFLFSSFLFSCFSFFCHFFIFPFFPFFHLLFVFIFIHCSVVRADAKSKKNRRTFPLVKNDDFLV